MCSFTQITWPPALFAWLEISFLSAVLLGWIFLLGQALPLPESPARPATRLPSQQSALPSVGPTCLDAEVLMVGAIIFSLLSQFLSLTLNRTAIIFYQLNEARAKNTASCGTVSKFYCLFPFYDFKRQMFYCLLFLWLFGSKFSFCCTSLCGAFQTCAGFLEAVITTMMHNKYFLLLPPT